MNNTQVVQFFQRMTQVNGIGCCLRRSQLAAVKNFVQGAPFYIFFQHQQVRLFRAHFQNHRQITQPLASQSAVHSVVAVAGAAQQHLFAGVFVGVQRHKAVFPILKCNNLRVVLCQGLFHIAAQVADLRFLCFAHRSVSSPWAESSWLVSSTV